MSKNECGISEDDCNKRGKKYKKDDIIALAENCGVYLYKENSKGEEVMKTIKELCRDIVNNQAQQKQQTQQLTETVVEPVANIVVPETIVTPVVQTVKAVSKYKCGMKKTSCKRSFNKNNKHELEELAIKCGIDIYKDNGRIKSISDLCDEIADTEVPEEDEVPVVNEIVEPTPEFVVEEDEDEEEQTQVLTVKELMAKKLPELKEIAGTIGVKKSQNKQDLVNAIHEKLKKNRKAEKKSEKQIEKQIEKVLDQQITPSSPRRKPKFRTVTDLIRHKRDELGKILKIKKPDFCDPTVGINCKDDNVCDIDKKECISPEEAQYKENKGKVESLDFKGKKVVGKKETIDDFINNLDSYEESKYEKVVTPKKSVSQQKKPITKQTMCEICTYVNEPGSIECQVCSSELTDKEIATKYEFEENAEIDDRNDEFEIEEGIQINDIENIEQILEEIQNKDNPELNNIEGLDEAKKKILMCLGLLA